jgi:hypothetical protein
VQEWISGGDEGKGGQKQERVIKGGKAKAGSSLTVAAEAS